MIKKILTQPVLVPSIMLLGLLFMIYNLVMITITEPASAFSGGKLTMVFVIGLLVFWAFAMLNLAIWNYKRIGETIEQENNQEQRLFLEENTQDDIKKWNCICLLPLAGNLFLFAMLLLYGSVVNIETGLEISLLFGGLSIAFLFAGIIVVRKIIQRGGF